VILVGRSPARSTPSTREEGRDHLEAPPGVGGALGGIQWSIAADAENAYAPVTDTNVPNGRPGLTAIRIKDGEVLWTTPAPESKCGFAAGRCGHGVSQAIAVAPGVVFGGHQDGWFRAYDSATGKVLWEFDTAGEPYAMLNGRTGKGGALDAAGVSIADGIVYVHSGYGGRGPRRRRPARLLRRRK